MTVNGSGFPWCCSLTIWNDLMKFKDKEDKFWDSSAIHFDDLTYNLSHSSYIMLWSAKKQVQLLLTWSFPKSNQTLTNDNTKDSPKVIICHNNCLPTNFILKVWAGMACNVYCKLDGAGLHVLNWSWRVHILKLRATDQTVVLDYLGVRKCCE